MQVAAGAIGQSPTRDDQRFQISVRAAGRLHEPGEFENVIIKAGDGALVRMKDIGTVELGAETYGSQLRFQGIDAVGFGVTQLPSANALDVERGVRAELDRLALHFPPGLKYQVSFNTTQVVAESIREVLITLAEAIALVVLVMFLFLQSWRSTLIPTITIPVSLIGAFAFVKLMDFSINTLTLVRHHPRHRDRRGRRDRGDREHRAAHPGVPDAGQDRRRRMRCARCSAPSSRPRSSSSRCSCRSRSSPARPDGSTRSSR